MFLVKIANKGTSLIRKIDFYLTIDHCHTTNALVQLSPVAQMEEQRIIDCEENFTIVIKVDDYSHFFYIIF